MPIEEPFRTLDDLGASLAAAGVSAEDRRMLLALAKPAIALEAKAEEDSGLAVGASKIGGAPDLPRGMAWPMRQPTATGRARVEGLRRLQARNPSDYFQREIALKEPLANRPAPLAFISQVDLAACAAAGQLDPDIPRDGWFAVFYDLVFRPWYGHEEGGNAVFRLLHIAGAAADPVRQPLPELGYPLFGELEDYRNRLPPARLTPIFTRTLPDGGSAPILTRYSGLRALPHQAWLDQLRRHHPRAANRIGGWPENIQGDMAIELAASDAGITLPTGPAFRAAAERIQPLAEQWVHVLQVGDYDNTINDFDGLYHIWIKRQHLRTRDFSQARLVYRTS